MIINYLARKVVEHIIENDSDLVTQVVKDQPRYKELMTLIKKDKKNTIWELLCKHDVDYVKFEATLINDNLFESDFKYEKPTFAEFYYSIDELDKKAEELYRNGTLIKEFSFLVKFNDGRGGKRLELEHYHGRDYNAYDANVLHEFAQKIRDFTKENPELVF